MIDTVKERMEERTAPAEPRHDGRSVVSLITDLSRETLTLAQQEIALAKAELADKAKAQARNTAVMVGSEVVIFAGILSLLTALIAGITVGLLEYMVWYHALWVSALIVGAAVVLIGVVMLTWGIRRMKQTGVTPEQTVQTLREDKQWLKEKVE